MDNSKPGGYKRSFLLLLFLYLTSQQSRFVEAAPDDKYSELSKNQVQLHDSTDPRTKFVSSLSQLLEQDEEGKRSSSFFPLRGKKTPNNADQYQFLPDPEDKRSQFFPLRGKKIPFDLKRASYFMPMRGRKSDEWDDFSDEEDKRASSFMPMRGKKRSESSSNTYQHFGKSGMYAKVKTDITLPSSSDSNRTEFKTMSSLLGQKSGSNETQMAPLRNKRSISFAPMRGRRLLSHSDEKSDSEFPERIVTTLLEKKAYSFMPMRGRRNSLFSDTYGVLRNSNDENESNLVEKDNADILQDTLDLMASMDSEDKRASSFMPMRGRRQTPLYHQYFDPLFEDKRKMSFMPMRGKKDSDNDSHFIDTDDKRASSFMPMRGKKDSDNDSHFMDTDNKRASSFMPMRGRRTLETTDYSGSENKRASSFMPMRGRRTLQTTDFLNNGDKRASSFMPMRGRRTFDITDDNEVKRASSFMPMRGRRASETAEYSDKRASSFMPMRGRRSVTNFDLHDTQDYKKQYSFMPMPGRRLLSYDSDESEKRAYSFMPMRGRRRSGMNDTDDVFYVDSDGYDVEKRGYAFMPMRGRRWSPEMDQANYFYHAYPFFMPPGIGSALISRPFNNRDIFIRAVASKNTRQYDWDSVKRAFHATRGKRLPKEYLDSEESDPEKEDDEIDEKLKSDLSLIENFRLKRNIFQPQVVAFQPQRKYIALKRPMSFFATRGKRFDGSLNERISNLP